MQQKQSTRQQKVGRLIQRELAVYFQLEMTTICLKNMVTVTSVRVTSDLSIARVYLSIYPSDKAEITLNSIQSNKKIIRYYLGTQVKNQLRIIPELEFFIDDSLDYVSNIEKLLKK